MRRGSCASALASGAMSDAEKEHLHLQLRRRWAGAITSKLPVPLYAPAFPI